MFSGTRLRQARELGSLTQTKLGKLIKRSQGTVANLEAGLLSPSQDLLAEIASVTQFPIAFFSQDPPIEIPSLMFRARAAMSRTEEAAGRRSAELVLEVVTQVLERYVAPIPINLPSGSSPVVAAQQMRRVMGLSPEEPITYLIHSIEKAGVTVLALPTNLRKVDAFSAWAGEARERPIIALCPGRPGDRLRWNVSHEVGHLILHRHSQYVRAHEHRQADQFAAELLLPEIAIREQFGPVVTLSTIAALKPRWGVAMQALIRRALDLNVISEHQYRHLFEQIGARGWRTREPANLDVPLERPSALRRMAEIAFGKPINLIRFAAEAQLSVEMIKQIIDGYQETAIPPATERPGKVIQLKG